MARTPSNMLALGTQAPNFSLPNPVTGTPASLQDIKGDKGTVVMFICNHCPFVKHVQDEFPAMANTYLPQGIGFVAISSNDVANYPEDSPAHMKALAEQLALPFAYLYDESQEVAKAYDAACTPDFYLFDQDLALVYRGQMDDSRPGNGKPVNGADLRLAMDSLLNGQPMPPDQKPSIGCNIKWK